MRRRFTLITRASALGLLVTAFCLPVAAQAGQNDGGDPNGNGYTAEVSIHFYGTGVPGGGDTTRTVTVSPSCWWAPAAADYTDAVKMLAWYDALTNGGQQTRGNIDDYGPRSIWKAEADAETAGTADISWYRAYCKDPADFTKFGVGSVDGSGADDGVGPIDGAPVTYVTFYYHPFNAGDPIPAPRVPPDQLAKAARDVMTVPLPTTDRNPKIDSPGAPTLVGLPTWFWVTDPLSVGGTGGTLDVTAELNQPDGRVWATVTAATGGLSLTSTYGNTSCPPRAALTQYASGVSQANACTVEFSHAAKSLAVTASTDWNATWVGSGGTGGDLDPLHQETTQQVAVAEVQNIVTR